MAEHSSRLWVSLQCFSRSETLTRMAEHVSRKWVTLQCRPELLTRMAEHASRLWVCFTRLEPLTRMAKHSSRWWVPLLCSLSLRRLETTDENGWTCFQNVSSSPVFEQIRTTDGNGWMHPASELLSSCLCRSEPLIKMDPSQNVIYFCSLILCITLNFFFLRPMLWQSF